MRAGAIILSIVESERYYRLIRKPEPGDVPGVPKLDHDRWGVRFRAWRDENGRLHREDGPAVLWQSGAEEWYKHGKRHRLLGPALTRIMGNRKEYWVDGKRLKQEPEDWTPYVAGYVI